MQQILIFQDIRSTNLIAGYSAWPDTGIRLFSLPKADYYWRNIYRIFTASTNLNFVRHKKGKHLPIGVFK